MLVYAANFNLKDIDIFEFINLAIEWVTNKNSYYNIPPFKWNGEEEQAVASSNGKVELTIYVLIEKDTVAIKLENTDENGIKWENQYSLVKNELYVQLQKYSTDVNDEVYVNSGFNLPYLLKMLFQRNKIQEHPIFNNNGTPTFIDISNIDIASDLIINGTKYDLPIVYVSKNLSSDSMYSHPVNCFKLSKTLMGIAYVVVESNSEVSQKIKEITDWQNPYDGAIQIFINKDYSKRLLKEHFTSEHLMRKKIFDIVFNRNFRVQKDDKFSLTHITHEIYNIRFKNLEAKDNEFDKIKSEYELAQKRIDELEQDLRDVKHNCYSYEAKNEALSKALSKVENGQSLFEHPDIPDLYEGEIFDCLYDLIKQQKDNFAGDTRSYEILNAFLLKNKDEYNGERANKIKQIPLIIKKNGKPNKQSIQQLKNIGLRVIESEHYKVSFPNGSQFAVLSCTPSDCRNSENVSHKMIRILF